MKKWSLVIALSGFIITAHAQKPNWQLKDIKQDSVFGISSEKAYKELLKDKKGKTVIVAIIDSGVDTTHEDLKPVLWRNRKEIKGNRKDDDNNGYTDDINGWSFLGSEKGNVIYDNTELTRLVREGQQHFGNLDNLPEDTTGLVWYKQLKNKHRILLVKANQELQTMHFVASVLDSMLTRMGKRNPTIAEIETYDPETLNETGIKMRLLHDLPGYQNFASYREKAVDEPIEHFRTQVEYNLNLSYDPRPIVGDDYKNITEKYYGCNDVTGPNAMHGTHVAGIVGAIRDNGLGINGVADHVQLMSIRTVPEGDERDKDVANAIRYAVNNGAQVINMSFGKPYSPNKKVVDEAIQYAMSKDVLLVHAAGNDGLNVDIEPSFYPNCTNADGKERASTWIEVGASGFKNDETLIANFSNYGKNSVDVFAPGVQIYSTVPGSKYAYLDGTSMAAPVVAGLAALIRSYYPKLTAVQVKEIIMNSVEKITHSVKIKEQAKYLSDLCRSGGIVNAYNALKLAATY
jgi:subtilisin family serine protease